MDIETRGKAFDQFISELPYMRPTVKKTKDDYTRIYECEWLIATVKAVGTGKHHKYEIEICFFEEFAKKEDSE